MYIDNRIRAGYTRMKHQGHEHVQTIWVKKKTRMHDVWKPWAENKTGYMYEASVKQRIWEMGSKQVTRIRHGSHEINKHI